MPSTVRDASAPGHLLLPEIHPTPAKASLRKAETDAWKLQVGAAVQRAVSLRGWTLKEFSAAMSRHERQCKRWMTGDERPLFDVMLAVESFRQPLVQAFAELAGEGVEVETVVTIRRRRALSQ